VREATRDPAPTIVSISPTEQGVCTLTHIENGPGKFAMLWARPEEIPTYRESALAFAIAQIKVHQD